MAPKRLSAWATKTAVYIRLPKRLLAVLFFGAAFALGAAVSVLLYPWRQLLRLWRRSSGEQAAVSRIDRPLLARMVAGAHAQLEQSRNYINRINVFPVADGDTGSNMLHTVAGMMRDCRAEDDRPLGAFAAALAQSAVLSARGNSGIILAQYFKGLTEPWRDLTVLTAPDFVRGLRNGARTARRAVDAPARGTILDVFDAAAAAGQKALRQTDNIAALTETVLEAAQTALNRTRHQMPVMRQAKVVDAGGAGFLHVLAGFVSVLQGKQIMVADPEAESGVRVHQEVDLTYRYCTEAVLESDRVTDAALKERIRDFGDCLHVISADGKLKLHLHTNEPDRLKTLLTGLGEITDWKVDDMVRMQKAHLARTTGRKARLALVVDGSMDLPVDLPDDLPLYTIPLPVYDDRAPERQLTDLTTADFYRRMATDAGFRPKTSQPTPEACLAVLTAAAEEAEEVLCLSISSALSGTYASLQQALQTLGNPKVYSVDTGLTSAGITIIAEAVGAGFGAGKSTAEILQTVYKLREQVRIYFLVENLRYLERGGRISRKQSIIGQLLHVQPLLTLTDGRVDKTPHKLMFPSAAKRAALLVAQVRAATDRPEQVFILQGGGSAAADELAVQLQAAWPNARIGRVTLNPVLGAHVGPGTIGVAFVRSVSG